MQFLQFSIHLITDFCIIIKTTGLTGLKVLANPREVSLDTGSNELGKPEKSYSLSFYQDLIRVYNKIILTLQQIPDNAAYKSYTMATVNDRLKIVQNVSLSLMLVNF